LPGIDGLDDAGLMSTPITSTPRLANVAAVGNPI
jgi:hypothetical protein